MNAYTKSILRGITIGVLLLACNRPVSFTAKYLNQPLPGKTAERFAPDLLPEDRSFRDAAFTPDGKEFYFTEIVDGSFTIMVSKYEGGIWTEPAIALFSGEYSDFEPCITRDGRHFLFGSMRPSRDKPDMTGDADLWIMDRTDEGWSEPRLMPAPVTSGCMEYFPSLTDDGTLYFGRNDKANTRGDIYVSRLKDGVYQQPEKLPGSVNKPVSSFNAFIARDESYILFSMYIDGETGWHADMFVSFHEEDGQWTEPINLGSNVNSPGNDHAPYVSYDGKYLFFSSTRIPPKSELDDHDILWVDAGIIENVRPK